MSSHIETLTPEEAKLRALEQREAVRDSLKQTFEAIEHRLHRLDGFQDQIVNARWALIGGLFAIGLFIGLKPWMKRRYAAPPAPPPPPSLAEALLVLKAAASSVLHRETLRLRHRAESLLK